MRPEGIDVNEEGAQFLPSEVNRAPPEGDEKEEEQNPDQMPHLHFQSSMLFEAAVASGNGD
jgi:hypothetical protein